jgi:hypothetical protein
MINPGARMTASTPLPNREIHALSPNSKAVVPVASAMEMQPSDRAEDGDDFSETLPA